MKNFRFELGQAVVLNVSGEIGTVLGRADYRYSNDAYYIRYRAGDGRATEAWWNDDALTEHVPE